MSDPPARAYMQTKSGRRAAIILRATIPAPLKRLEFSSSLSSCHQGTCLLGMTREWPVLKGLISRMHKVSSSSQILWALILPATISQNTQDS